MVSNQIGKSFRRLFLVTLLTLASLVGALLTASSPAVAASTVVPLSASAQADICNYTSSRPTIQYGSTGAAVRQAQCYYNYATTGSNLVIDGIFGSDTRAKIIHFQQCVGITADGIVGPVTWSNLSYWANSASYAC